LDDNYQAGFLISPMQSLQLSIAAGSWRRLGIVNDSMLLKAFFNIVFIEMTGLQKFC
jgi:hypothetical protein